MTLSLSAPQWAKPDGNVTITVHAKSYIGVAVAGATMQLAFSLAGVPDL